MIRKPIYPMMMIWRIRSWSIKDGRLGNLRGLGGIGNSGIHTLLTKLSSKEEGL